jgi:hypothetical protein
LNENFCQNQQFENNYYCQRYNSKICAKKCVCIKTLRNRLLVTLKRFEFDLNTVVGMVIALTFMMQLSFNSWAQQGIRERSAQPVVNQDNSSEYPMN